MGREKEERKWVGKLIVLYFTFTSELSPFAAHKRNKLRRKSNKNRERGEVRAKFIMQEKEEKEENQIMEETGREKQKKTLQQ